MPINHSLFGSYITKKFSDMFPSWEEFQLETTNNPLLLNKDGTQIMEPYYMMQTYYLLYSHYGNSTVANLDPNQFEFKLFSIIAQYGPTWAKKLEIQKKLRELSESDELFLSSRAIYNHSFNPSTEPSTSTLEELTTINDQNTSAQKKSKLSGYMDLYLVLQDDITHDYLTKFSGLFLKIVEPQDSLWYVSGDLTDDGGEE